MNILVKIATSLIIGVLIYQSQVKENYSIEVTVENATNNEGKIFLALYNSETNFLEKSYKGTKSEIINNSCTITFEDIPSGPYAISVFHDENNNGEMDSNFMGIPKEDYGCSNDATGFMGPPKWKNAKFELKENKSITITL